MIKRVAVALALALLGAGCGSSSPDKPAGQSAPRSGIAAAFAFSGCMRSHGVSDFPDPQVTSSPGQQTIKLVISAGVAQSPQFKAAQRACRGILPGPANLSPAQVAAQQHAREQGLFAFARCLRAHGVTNFPDPTSQGRLTLQMVTAAGVDLHAPSVRSAGLDCAPASHGLITGADVEQATSGGQ